LGSEKKHRVASFLQQIIRHCLLVQYWTKERPYNRGHWRSKIVNFKDQLNRYLTPNLYHYLEKEFESIYQSAIRFVRQKTENQVEFPDTCPYPLANLLDPDWFPPEE
jgi:hypothetical protein